MTAGTQSAVMCLEGPGNHGAVPLQRSEDELTLVARARLGDGATLDEAATWLVDAQPDLHSVLLVKILGDASGEDVERSKALVLELLPPAARSRPEALWEAAEMIWSGQMDIADEEPGLHPGGARA
jgi:hypothetical protein